MTKLNSQNDTDKYVSTSVLAKSIGIDRDELFTLLESLQFIVRSNNRWRLTPAGEVAGGIYRRRRGSPKFIVWSLAILEHEKFAHFEIQDEIPESHLHSGIISTAEYDASVTIPVYPTIDIDFVDIKKVIEQKLVNLIASSSILRTPEVTDFLTQTVCHIGDNLGYQIEKEPLYHITDLVDRDWIGAVGDVVWKKNSTRMVMWEIDSTNKPRSVVKLMSGPAKYNVWLPWGRKMGRVHINCLLHRQDCKIVRPDPNILSDL